MRVGVPRETAAGERRVALIPETVARLTGAGYDVVVEAGAGGTVFRDDAYSQAGATLGAPWDADVVAKVQAPSAQEAEALREGGVLIAFLQPLSDPEGIERLARRGVTAFALELR